MGAGINPQSTVPITYYVNLKPVQLFKGSSYSDASMEKGVKEIMINCELQL